MNSINKKEIEKFSNMAAEWWDPEGKFKPLHKFNPIRIKYIKENIIKEFQLKNKKYPLSGINILDIGCGSPSFLKACQEYFNCKTMGIDFSDTGWKNETAEFEGIDLQIAQIEDLNNELKPDVITMWHYLEHDYAPLENLMHLKSISKSSTTLVIEIPNFESKSRKKYGKNWAGWHTPRHLSLFSPNNIELLLQKAGWKAKKILTYGTMNPYLLYWMSEMELKQIRWDKSMEKEFMQFTLGMVKFFPWKLREKRSSLGVMTVVAVPN